MMAKADLTLMPLYVSFIRYHKLCNRVTLNHTLTNIKRTIDSLVETRQEFYNKIVVGQ